MATRIGLEPTTPSVTGWCSNQLSYRAIPEQLLLLLNGAADEARTRYLHLGKVALYQMSYGRTFHLFLPVCCPATLVIIPHTPAVVNHKITFFQKRMSFNSGTFFLFCVQHHIPPFHLVSHGCVHKQNTVAFYFTNYYNKEDALSNGKLHPRGCSFHL